MDNQMERYKETLLIRIMSLHIGRFLLPTIPIILLFLPYYVFEYGGINAGLSQMECELEQALALAEEKEKEHETHD